MLRKSWGKRIFTALLAGAVTFSNFGVPGGNEFSVVVQAAETQPFYSSEKSVATDEMNLETEDWNKKTTLIYDQAIDGISITESFTMTADVSLGKAAYESIAERDYLKVQGVVKLGEKWEYTKCIDEEIKKLTQSDFTESDGAYSTSVAIKFENMTVSTLKEIDFEVVGQGFQGSVTIGNVTLTGSESGEEILPSAEPTVIDSFEDEEAGSMAGWENEAGYQYDQTVTVAVAEVLGGKMLRADLDYTGCGAIGWSEAKIKKSFSDGLDISAYNILSFDIVYPESFDGKFKIKAFAKGAETDGLINKDVTVSALSDWSETVGGIACKKASVTIKFTPSAEKITDLTLGIVGVNTEFKGSVYLDNITLSQYDAASDFTEITAVPGTGSTADISKMPGEVTLSDAQATSQTRALYAYLQSLGTAKQVLFGHQNDTHKHVTAREGVYSDTKDITDSISGVVGIDSLALTGVELGLNDVDEAIAKSIEISKSAAAEGAIITLSTHMPNMSDEKIIATPDAERKYDFSACDFSEAKNLENNCAAEVLPGGKYNAQFTTYLDIIADYALGLQEANIPVLFRPFHENTGGWFWWGSATTDKETYNAMFRYTHDYLESRGVHNFLYVYSPNGPVSYEDYAERYPGDDYVDIVAFDYYDDYNSYPAEYSETFMTSLNETCAAVKRFADEHGKVAAIAETGVRVMKADGSDNEGILVKDNPIKGQNWYSKVNAIAAANGMPYFMVWANFSDTNFYVPYKYNDTHGQELINEFIDFYNEDSSIFADGTKFYDEAANKEVTAAQKNRANGYFTNLFSKSVIKEETVLRANVKNASTVEFVLENAEKGVVKTITTANTGGNTYEGTVTADMIAELGGTDVGTVSLNADGNTLVKLSFISFGKDKDTLAADVIDDFELYYGDNDYLNGTYTENSAANCKSSFTLDAENLASGSYGGSFDYQLKTSGPEVWTGRMKGLDNSDYSAYNALSMWVKPDGNGQKLVIQLVSNGEDFEAYLTDFVAGTEAKYVTIPFSSLKGKSGGTFDPAHVSKFAVWCNSIIPEGESGVDISSSIVFDDIRFVNVDESTLELTSGGYALSDEPVTGGETEEPTETPEDVAATGITLSKTSLTLKAGASAALTATVAPANATDKTVTWTSSNTKVATVINGTVKAVANGTATITAATKNGKRATCTVTVTTDTTGVKLSRTSATVGKGSTLSLTATVSPASASDTSLTWTSSNKKVATVDKNGKVKGIKKGTATITVKTANGQTAECKITVSEVTLNAKSFPLQVRKSTTALEATVSARGDSVKSWKSSNTKIATVNSKGKITAKKTGTAKITVTTKRGATATCTVKVQKGKVTTKSLSISEKKLTLQTKKSTTLTLERNPISATEKITWTSSNTKVAAVNSKGKVTAKKAGTTTITARTSNGKKVTCKVTVRAPKVTLRKTSASIKVGKTAAIQIKSTYPAKDEVKSYKSSNKKVATVNRNGKVTGVKKGKATITVTMKSGAKATFKVTVK